MSHKVSVLDSLDYLISDFKKKKSSSHRLFFTAVIPMIAHTAGTGK